MFSAQRLSVSQTGPLPATLTVAHKQKKEKEKSNKKKKEKHLLLTSSPLQWLALQQTRPRKKRIQHLLPQQPTQKNNVWVEAARARAHAEEEDSVGPVLYCRCRGGQSTWDDGVDADGSVASQGEAEVLLPPVDANDPGKQEVIARIT